jgi:MerR family transcriptional regulator/heat shock protein HspR
MDAWEVPGMGDGEQDRDRGLYGISVAAELTGVHPQMLRVYETRGLLEPDRTEGGTRRYSANDLRRVERITSLVGGGLNLAGVELVLRLEGEAARLREEVASLRTALARRQNKKR